MAEFLILSKIYDGILKSEHRLNQDHVAHRSRGDAKQRVLFPHMQTRHQQTGQKFGNPVRARENIHVPQAVDHQHSHNRVGKDAGQIQHEPGRFPFPPKDQKRDARRAKVTAAITATSKAECRLDIIHFPPVSFSVP